MRRILLLRVQPKHSSVKWSGELCVILTKALKKAISWWLYIVPTLEARSPPSWSMSTLKVSSYKRDTVFTIGLWMEELRIGNEKFAQYLLK